MGAALSSVPPSSPAVISQLTNEFHRLQQSASKVKAHQRKASQTFAPLSPSPIVSQCLTLEQLLQFQSPSHIPINFHSLSTLYALDLHGDGVLTLPLLLDFYQWCEHKCSEWVKTDRRSKLESLFTFKMFHDSHQLGDRHLVQWLCNLVATSGEVVARGGVTYVHRDSVMAAFTVFRAHLPSTVTFQQWFDQLQQIGETQSLLDLDDDSLDDFIPIQALALFTSYFLTGFFALFSALGLQALPAPVVATSEPKPTHTSDFSIALSNRSTHAR